MKENYMSEQLELENQVFENKELNMPSLKHSGVQTNLTILLGNDERFTLFIELSLDATSIDLSQFGLKTKDELIPDICAYLEPPIIDDRLGSDETRVAQIPDLAIEVLSPSQTINELLKKIDAFFALGIKACWLVMPSLEVIRVFSRPLNYKDFNIISETEVIDGVMDIRLPIQKIFKWRCPPMPSS
jgi:Uma2 family endonuclease